MTVKTICGPSSTTVVPPHQALLEGINEDGTTVQISGSFTSSNENCPIVEQTMTDDARGAFEMTQSSPNVFTVERVPALIEEEDQPELERFFTI